MNCTQYSIQVYAKKCADFSTQQQEQKWYEQKKKSGLTGWKILDRDGDGQACDYLPGGNGNKCSKEKK
ncbi:MAG: hypothetical protein ACN6NX_00220 [Acinetobacter sp.]